MKVGVWDLQKTLHKSKPLQSHFQFVCCKTEKMTASLKKWTCLLLAASCWRQCCPYMSQMLLMSAFFAKVSIIKWLKSIKALSAVHLHRTLEGNVRLYYSCQGQWFEKATQCIMHSSIWLSPMRSVKIKLPHPLPSQQLRSLDLQKSTRADVYSSIYSQVAFLKCQKMISTGVLWFLFSLCDVESKKRCCDRGQNIPFFI